MGRLGLSVDQRVDRNGPGVQQDLGLRRREVRGLQGQELTQVGRERRHELGGGRSVDIEPNYGVAVGNVYDYADVGVMGRFGFNLPKDYGPMRIQPSLPGSDYFEPTAGFGAYIFAGADGRAIARNLFLDGNSFETSRSVSKKNLVGDLVLGAAVTFDAFRLAFTHDIRTREYRTQPKADQFGSVNLTVRF